MTNTSVQVAEQNQGFEKWPNDGLFSREVTLLRSEDGSLSLQDEDPILGWIRVEKPFYDFSKGDLPDAFRIKTGRGHIVRKPVDRCVSLPWLNVEETCDFHLKRSLTTDGDVSDAAKAAEGDVPSGFYYMDYDMFCRIGRAANSLHALAMEATTKVLNDPDAEHLLEHYFGIPKEIQPLVRRSFELTPPLGGRFDFGYDGKRIVMLEYNCDSSGALLEGCSTQQKMAEHYGIKEGDSTGSFLSAKCLSYFKTLQSNPRACPAHKLIHFMIDEDDEERYTALCMMKFAEQSGFRCKLCVGVSDFNFSNREPIHIPPEALPSDNKTIIDADGEEVLLVWKTWSWDTVLHQYANQKNFAEKDVEATPTLSDILLNDHVRVLEPLWKAITGSKAILPYMYGLAPDHENMVAASFARTKEIISVPHISKPVNGRAGQNIVMHDAVSDEGMLEEAPMLKEAISSNVLIDSVSNSFALEPPEDRENECSPGKFFDSVQVYQQRLFLKKFDNKYFPIFCGWVIGDEFGGVVVREDTSKITKLASVVVPARVIRETSSFFEEHTN
ncbi:trypanothione synthetase/amidase [Angomonas deanei]|uniref:Glutathionylspermidine synthase preATP-grasp, putative n=1 Tax=Angomonas deanei TaxID=59799 RepID=A0A7G2CC95_9TRYP|nr:trypanothione synthetase/amidase [Angomonas deanei]CAD2217436.1 Glutathionylspermidine synthase preATP-grasp, putative [Angomonas deanei]|eukprot:EPY32029.1 trypanothione synthetase/amidase [Angomonas deanei]